MFVETRKLPAGCEFLFGSAPIGPTRPSRTALGNRRQWVAC